LPLSFSKNVIRGSRSRLFIGGINRFKWCGNRRFFFKSVFILLGMGAIGHGSHNEWPIRECGSGTRLEK
jgi:hypothetical protein